MPEQRDTARSELCYVAGPAVHGARGDPAIEGAGWCACSTTAVPGPHGPVVVLRVAGEVDLSSVDLLRTALGSVLAQRPAHLVVDLAALTFCSAWGLAVLGEAGDTALGYGTGYAVAGVAAGLNRVWAMGWLAAQRPIGFPTVAGAVLSALAHQVGQQDRARREPKQLIPADTSPARDTAVPLVARVPVPAPVGFA